MDTFLLIASVLINLIILTALIIRTRKIQENKSDMSDLKSELVDLQEKFRQEINSSTQNSIKLFGDMIADNQKHGYEFQSDRLAAIDKNLSEKQDNLQKNIVSLMKQQEERIKTFSMENEQKLDLIRHSVEQKVSDMQEDNNKKLDQMRQIVDEKLQKTIEQRMTESFKLVNERLEQVYKGLGEMQTLASGVGDLKKVLSNVKTRGILGEIQLGAILEEILAPEQYETNVATVRNSACRVEYAVKIPNEDGTCVYLPIDSKFPGDTYAALKNAYDEGDPEEIQAASKQLISTIKAEAKDIHEKYIDPPYTTDFAIMFLPFEGLYAEVVNRGMVEELQRLYRVNIAGPSTMAALLNSLQMGFRTFAIQQRSAEVWQVLGAVKTEFDKFSDVLVKAQKALNNANDQIDKLVGTRTRMIRSKLKNVTALTDIQTKSVLEIDMTDEYEVEETV